jgi:hypothetical protein
MDNDEIFNNARKNMIPNHIWEQLKEYPAFKKKVEQSYYIDIAASRYPNEIKILRNVIYELSICLDYETNVRDVLKDMIITYLHGDRQETPMMTEDHYVNKLQELYDKRRNRLDRLYREAGLKK